MSLSFLREVEAIICGPKKPVEKASAIWLNTMMSNHANYEIALYLFEQRVDKGFHESPRQRFQQLLLRSQSGDNAAKREAIQLLTDCLEDRDG